MTSPPLYGSVGWIAGTLITAFCLVIAGESDFAVSGASAVAKMDFAEACQRIRVCKEYSCRFIDWALTIARHESKKNARILRVDRTCDDWPSD